MLPVPARRSHPPSYRPCRRKLQCTYPSDWVVATVANGVRLPVEYGVRRRCVAGYDDSVCSSSFDPSSAFFAWDPVASSGPPANPKSRAARAANLRQRRLWRRPSGRLNRVVRRAPPRRCRSCGANPESTSGNVRRCRAANRRPARRTSKRGSVLTKGPVVGRAARCRLRSRRREGRSRGRARTHRRFQSEMIRLPCGSVGSAGSERPIRVRRGRSLAARTATPSWR
jgi:hypothetical protein